MGTLNFAPERSLRLKCHLKSKLCARVHHVFFNNFKIYKVRKPLMFFF